MEQLATGKMSNSKMTTVKLYNLQCGIAEHKKSFHLKLHHELLVQNE